MNPYDQATPGNNIIDLRDVAAERDRIYEAIRDAAAELDADEIEVNANDPRGDNRCSNECVCTVTEKIDADVYGSDADLVEAVEGWDAMLDAAGLTDDDLDYLRAVSGLVDEMYDDLHTAANNEPIMVLDSYFIEYAEQLADDIGAIGRDAAADALKQDYTEVTFGGHTYWWRAY